MTGIGEARSLLFVPGTRADRYDRALASGADPARLVTDVENALSIGGKLAIRPRHIAAINYAWTPAPALARATRTANSTTANGTT